MIHTRSRGRGTSPKYSAPKKKANPSPISKSKVWTRQQRGKSKRALRINQARKDVKVIEEWLNDLMDDILKTKESGFPVRAIVLETLLQNLSLLKIVSPHSPVLVDGMEFVNEHFPGRLG